MGDAAGGAEVFTECSAHAVGVQGDIPNTVSTLPATVFHLGLDWHLGIVDYAFLDCAPMQCNWLIELAYWSAHASLNSWSSNFNTRGSCTRQNNMKH
jgi:hypothetical protein